MVMFAGIDWGGHHHQVAVVATNGEVVVNRRVTHDRSGLERAPCRAGHPQRRREPGAGCYRAGGRAGGGVPPGLGLIRSTR